MPNWCVNKLSIKGPKADIAAFRLKARNETPLQTLERRLNDQPDPLLDFNAFVPYPQQFTDQDKLAEEARQRKDWSVKDGYNSGGYEWCCANWSTKWNASSVEDHGTYLQFETAWGPPSRVIEAASVQFPTLTLTLRWFERGAGKQGRMVYKAGTVISDVTRDYRGLLGG